jgi:hypothetical protein
VGRANKFDAAGASIGVGAVRWDANSTAAHELANLGTAVGGSTTSVAYGVNDANDIVGMAEKYTSTDGYLGARAVRWDAAGAIHELDVVSHNFSGFASTEARAINSSGVVAGVGRKYIGNVSQGTQAIRWDAATGHAIPLAPLGPPQPGSPEFAEAVAVDSAGNIVGHSTGGPYLDESFAVIWPAGETHPIALNALINDWQVILTAATGINDAGQIVGYAQSRSLSGVDYRGFILTPVPEPATCLVLVAFCFSAAVKSRSTREPQPPSTSSKPSHSRPHRSS